MYFEVFQHNYCNSASPMSLHSGAFTTSTTSFIIGVVMATVSGTAILGIEYRGGVAWKAPPT